MSETSIPRQDSLIDAFREMPRAKKRLAVLLTGILAIGASSAVFGDYKTRNDTVKYTRERLIKTYNNRAGANVLELLMPSVSGGPYEIVVHLPNCFNDHSAITEDNGMLEVSDQVGNKHPLASDNMGAFKPLPDIDAYDVGADICETLR